MNLEPFFNPSSILIIGVSRKTFTFNYTILKNLLEIFYKGKIYILNPNASEILGVKSYSSLEDLPEIPDLAVIVINKKIVEIIENLAQFGVKYLTIQSELKPRTDYYKAGLMISDICEKHGITYLGPSMLGIINFIDN
ncbi:hypothetical protein LCGC14_1958210, partial [marine sediment metagenome]